MGHCASCRDVVRDRLTRDGGARSGVKIGLGEDMNETLFRGHHVRTWRWQWCGGERERDG